MIDAANHIRHRPCVWGGGHRNWNARGYDCSGAVSYVLHAGGLLEYSLDDDRNGPGWSETMRSGHGFRLRQPLGILSADPLI